jgi:C4-dicarboxylate transporter DctM subunit
MSAYQIAFILLAMMFLLLGSGMWIGLALGIAGVIGLYLFTPYPVAEIVALQTWNRSSIYVLTAIPLFVLCAELLLTTRLARWLFDGLAPWVVWLPGRLMHTCTVGCAFMAGVTGSSTADCMTVGRINYTELTSRGYDRGLAAGALAGAGTLGILIPPSIVPIMFVAVVGGSVGELFLAGILPGIMVAGLFSLWIIIRTIVDPMVVPPIVEPYTWGDRVRALLKIAPTLSLVGFILGSLYSGIATPTEAAALSVAAALIMALIGRSLTWPQFVEALLATCRLTSFIMLIIVGATLLGIVTSYTKLPATIVADVGQATTNIYLILLLLGVVYVLLGMFLDPNSVILLTLPVVVPVMDALGVDRVWFCVYLILMVEVANVTPPVGFNLYVIQGISGMSLSAVSYATLPFVILLLLSAVIITVFPQVPLWLPRHVFSGN